MPTTQAQASAVAGGTMHAPGEPIFKDGNPGWITGYDSTISDGNFADILMADGRQTFVRLPDYGGRITPREVTC